MKYRIFAYGLLINKNYLLKSVASAHNIHPAKVYGFVRVFNFPSLIHKGEGGNPSVVLNVEKSEWNEYVNGIIFEMEKKDFAQLLEREEAYECIEIEVAREGEKTLTKAFMLRALHFEAYDFLFGDSKQEEYLKICLEGAKSYGEDFLKEFKKTTFIGDKTLEELGY